MRMPDEVSNRQRNATELPNGTKLDRAPPRSFSTPKLRSFVRVACVAVLVSVCPPPGDASDSRPLGDASDSRYEQRMVAQTGNSGSVTLSYGHDAFRIDREARSYLTTTRLGSTGYSIWFGGQGGGWYLNRVDICIAQSLTNCVRGRNMLQVTPNPEPQEVCRFELGPRSGSDALFVTHCADSMNGGPSGFRYSMDAWDGSASDGAIWFDSNRNARAIFALSGFDFELQVLDWNTIPCPTGRGGQTCQSFHDVVGNTTVEVTW